MAAGYTCGGSRWQLPGWARGSLAGLGGKGVSGTLHRDRSTPLPILQSRGEGGEERMRSRIEQLERNIIFLQQQHTETLRQLHSQTEQLKRENRELNFQLIMCCCNRQPASSSNSRDKAHTAAADGLHVVLLQKEIQQLKQALAEEKCRNGRILALLQTRLPDSSTSPVQEQERALQRTEERNIFKTPSLHPQTQVCVPADQAREKRERRESLDFPALKPHLLGDMAEKQRRRQAMQKRFSRTVNNHTL